MELIDSSEINCSISNFYSALRVYLFKQQVINRKLSCVTKVSSFRITNSKIKSRDNLIENLKNLSVYSKDIVSKKLETLDIEYEECESEEICDSERADDIAFLVVIKLIPRNTAKFQQIHILSYIAVLDSSALIVPLEDTRGLTTNIEIQLCYRNGIFNLFGHPGTETNWLKHVMFPKFTKWMKNITEENSPSINCQHLINQEEYNVLYSILKTKYSFLVKDWPEVTDPSKFVFEDLAIASYLILLWKQEKEKSGSQKIPSFVDLGCGNGLLVYILVLEGFEGCGYDLKRRTIWDTYPSNVVLIEEAVIPSDASVFPNTDWIIGNHSDELSVWIPIIAARSSYTTNFFLLPCCSYELDGSKYQRKTTNKSQYMEFVDYLQQISEICNFKETLVDKLKIPSTKRICLVGKGRNHEEKLFKENANNIQDFINDKLKQTQPQNGAATPWARVFTAREAYQPIRNCTKIDKKLSDNIIATIFNKLLSFKNYGLPFSNWNSGGTLKLIDAAELIPSEMLKQIKSEFGGLQTLLKNNHQIFQVIKGQVTIKAPITIREQSIRKKPANKKQKIPTKIRYCYFFKNHPQQCPLTAEDCCFVH